MKNAATDASATPGKALIFIPDISGFTRFVSETEISHSQHIIRELLTLLLEANQLKLEVSEVEGDAILFFRMGEAPTATELLAQIKKMFTAFHLHLKKYESHRVCNCGACRTAHQLTIKFVTHYGDLAINKVQQFAKLFGKEVIVAHRLLKNDIDQHEYALFTQEVLATCPEWNSIQSIMGSELVQSSQEYDSGKVDYGYVTLQRFYQEIPPLTPDDFRIPGNTMKLMETSGVIHAPVDLVFDVIADINWRNQWIPGLLPEVEAVNSSLTQAGQTHRCLANGPVIVSYDYAITNDTISFSETDTKKTQWMVYVLNKMDDHTTRLTTTCYAPRNPLKQLMFNLVMRKKFKVLFSRALLNLAAYCESLAGKGERHPITVQLFEKEMMSM